MFHDSPVCRSRHRCRPLIPLCRYFPSSICSNQRLRRAAICSGVSFIKAQRTVTVMSSSVTSSRKRLFGSMYWFHIIRKCSDGFCSHAKRKRFSCAVSMGNTRSTSTTSKHLPTTPSIYIISLVVPVLTERPTHFLERFIHFRARDVQRRQEPHDVRAGRDADQSMLGKFQHRRPRFQRQLDADHQSKTPHFANDGAFCRQCLQFTNEILASFARVAQQVIAVERIEHRECDRTGQGRTAERRAMRARAQHVRVRPANPNRGDWESAAETLRPRDRIGLDVGCNGAESAKVSRAPQSALYFVKHQQKFPLVAESPQSAQKFWRCQPNPAFP